MRLETFDIEDDEEVSEEKSADEAAGTTVTDGGATDDASGADDGSADDEMDFVGSSPEDIETQRRIMEAVDKYADEDSDDELETISLRSILRGDILMSRFVIRQIAFLLFLWLLVIVHTTLRFNCQDVIIENNKLRDNLKDIKYKVLTQSSELMNLTRQSNVESAIKDTPDSILKPSVTAPFLLKVDNAEDNE